MSALVDSPSIIKIGDEPTEQTERSTDKSGITVDGTCGDHSNHSTQMQDYYDDADDHGCSVSEATQLPIATVAL